MNIFNINTDHSVEQDKVFLCDRMLNIIGNGEIQGVENLKTKLNLKSNDEISFKIYKYNNGILNTYWEKIDDLSIIYVQNKGYFEISVPKTKEDCDYKNVTGVSLCEAETSQTNITLEINTEDVTSIEGYVPIILYDPVNTNASLLHRIFSCYKSESGVIINSYMPHYKIGHVDESIAKAQRMFSCNNISVYDFLHEIEEELECIFIFDKFSRTVNCYKLDNFGEDSGVFIDDTKNISETLTITGDKDSVKNCFKIEGGDDVITNRISNRLIGGNYIWFFSKYQLNQMSIQLQNALRQRESIVNEYQSTYDSLWDMRNNLSEKKWYYESSMMPSFDTDNITAVTVFEKIFGQNGKIKYGCISNKNQDQDYVVRSIKNYAKIIAPSYYTIELNNVSSKSIFDNGDYVINSITFSVHIYLTGEYEDDNITLKDEYTSSSITLPIKKGYTVYVDKNLFTNDYFLYLKQQMDIAEEKNKITDETVVFDPPLINGEDMDNLPFNHYGNYCLNRLISFSDAYNSCSQILAKLNSQIPSDELNLLKYVTDKNSYQSIYDALLSKYNSRQQLVEERIQYLKNKITDIQNQLDYYDEEIQKIRLICDMESFLKNYQNGIYGDSLWKELCSFRREDTYRNDNYIAENLDEATITENIQGLIKQANIEIAKACEVHYSLNITLANILTMKEFQPFWEKFNLGNYILVRIDDIVYKLRLISITCDYNNTSTLEVEFSDTVESNNLITDFKNLIQQTKSMATNFGFVMKQAQKGKNANDIINVIRDDGLDIANTMITNSYNQDFSMDKYGITGKKWDDVSERYETEEVRLTSNLLCFTTDNWKHTKSALGKICYFDEENNKYVYAYGLNAEVLVSDIILSENLKIKNKSGTYTIDDNGFIMSKDNASIVFNPSTPSMVAMKGNDTVLDFNSKGNGELLIKGQIEGSTIVGSSIYSKGEQGNVLIDNGNIFIETNSPKDYLLYSSCMNIDVSNKIHSISLSPMQMFFLSESTMQRQNNYSSYYTSNNIQFYINENNSKSQALLIEPIYRNPITGFIDYDADGYSICSYEAIKINSIVQCDSICSNSNVLTISTPLIDDDLDTNGILLENGNTNSLHPIYNNNLNLGSPNFLWKNIYSFSPTITTSDKKEKTNINYDNLEKYIALFDSVNPCIYQFKNGTSNRIHTGWISQDFEKAMKDLGMSDSDFAGFCKDKINLENGQTKELYSLRYDECSALMAMKLKDMENKYKQAFECLENKISYLEEKLGRGCDNE